MDNLFKYSDAHRIINNLYGLLMEVNYFQTENMDFDISLESDQVLLGHLNQIKKLKTKYKSSMNRSLFDKVIDEYNKLKQLGTSELQSLLTPKEQETLIPLFRKFEELSKNDEELIKNEQELLKLMEKLKAKIDNK